MKQQHITESISKSRGVSKRAAFDGQAESSTWVDDELQGERLKCQNNRSQAWAKNTFAIYITAAIDKFYPTEK